MFKKVYEHAVNFLDTVETMSDEERNSTEVMNLISTARNVVAGYKFVEGMSTEDVVDAIKSDVKSWLDNLSEEVTSDSELAEKIEKVKEELKK